MENNVTDVLEEKRIREIQQKVYDYKAQILGKLQQEANKDFRTNADLNAMLKLKDALFKNAVPIDLSAEVASKTNIVVSDVIAQDPEYVQECIDALAKYISNYYKFCVANAMSNQIFLNLAEGMQLMLIPPSDE